MTVARAHLADAGRAAVRRGGALLIGVVIVAAILFNKQAMTAADAVATLQSSTPLRAGLFLAWVLASAPAARALFGTPTTLYLRSLAPPSRFYLPVTAALIAAETPWLVLHARGGGPLAGLAATSAAAAAHALLAGRQLFAAGSILAAVAFAPSWGWLALLAGIGLAAGIPAAWRAAAVAPQRAHAVVAGPPPLALALAYLVSSWRGFRPAWTRAVLVVAGGSAATALVGSNHALGGAPLVRLSLGMGAPIVAIALGGVIQAVLAAETQSRWILDSTGVPISTRTFARGVSVALVGAVAGVIHGALSAGPAGAAASVPWGAALAVIQTAAVRRAGERDDVAFVLSAATAAIFSIAAGVW